MLLINYSIVSLGQTGDTLTCYTNDELKKITIKVVYANECDTLLKISEQESLVKDTAIFALKKALVYSDSINNQVKAINNLQYSIIDERNKELNNLSKNNTKLTKQNKVLKIALVISGSLLFGTGVALFLVH